MWLAFIKICVFLAAFAVCIVVRWSFGIDLFERGVDAGISLALSIFFALIAVDRIGEYFDDKN